MGRAPKGQAAERGVMLVALAEATAIVAIVTPTGIAKRLGAARAANALRLLPQVGNSCNNQGPSNRTASRNGPLLASRPRATRNGTCFKIC